MKEQVMFFRWLLSACCPWIKCMFNYLRFSFFYVWLPLLPSVWLPLSLAPSMAALVSVGGMLYIST